MALINCPECGTQVSDSAYKCTSCGYTIKKPKRGFFGKIFKWGFILFNIMMAVWLFSYWGSISEMVTDTTNEYEQAGAAIGATMGTGMLFGLWALGDIILGALVLFTRPRA